MRRAVFIDRDGTIIQNKHHLSRPSGLRILLRTPSALALLNRLGFLVVVVTNQSVVARGLASKKEIDDIHALLIERLGTKKAKIDAIYFCPHHLKGTVLKYRFRCRCRKPQIGMILRAIRRFHVDRKESFLIGDSTSDILAGKRAGLKTILVRTGFGGKDGLYSAKPDWVAKDIFSAAKIIQREIQV